MLKAVSDYLSGELEIPVQDGKVDISTFNLIFNTLKELNAKADTLDKLLKKYIELTNDQSVAIIELNANKPREEVNHPKHYNSKSKETIQIIQESMNDHEFIGFLLGNVIKYTERYKFKGGKTDLKKAEWYFNKYLEFQHLDDRFKTIQSLVDYVSQQAS